MKVYRYALFNILLGLLPFASPAAGKLFGTVATLNAVSPFPEMELFKKAESTVSTQRGTHTVIEIVEEAFSSLLQHKPERIRIPLPENEGGFRSALIYRTEITTADFRVGTLGSSAIQSLPSEKGIHYQGVLEEDTNSLVALSITNEGITGMIATNQGQWEMVSDPQQRSRCHLFRSDLKDSSNTYDCSAVEVPAQFRISAPNRTSSASCKSVSVYFECDYRLYTDKGSNIQSLTAYVTSFFNQVAALYRNEDIELRLSGINIWTSPDPYASLGSAAEVLPAFRAATGNAFNGTLAHLLTTRNIGGGMSYLDVLCIRSYAHGVSYIHASNNGTPSYSWTVEVVAHEIGHNIGSHHTQWCGWMLENGSTGALDNCYSTEGGCPGGATPVNGGTIMSYCHLTSHGINFARGFGARPGDLLREKVANASCLTASGDAPTGLSNTSITAVSGNLSWNPNTSTGDYIVHYKSETAVDWITCDATSGVSMTLTGLRPSTTYIWKVRTDCSDFSEESRFTTSSAIGCTAPSGIVSTCGRNGEVNISWNKSAGKTTYTVRYRLTGNNDWIIREGILENQCTLAGMNPQSDYEVQVRSTCSDFSDSKYITTPATGCIPPSGGYTNAISRNSVTFNWSGSTGASNYTIRYRKSGTEQWTQLGPRTGTHLNLTGLAPGTTYEWKVKANCSGYSATQSFTTVEANPLPAAELTGETLQLFPNPASTKFEIRFEKSAGESEAARMMLSDMVGKVLLSQPFTSDESKLEVDISELPDGIYIVQITDASGKNFKKRLIKR